MKDLRDFLTKIEGMTGEFLTTTKAVNPTLELTRVIYKLEKEQKDPAVLFKNVSGCQYPVLTNLFGNRKRLAAALDTNEAEVNLVYREREKNLLPPVLVSTAPVQEIVFEGNDVRLDMLPVVTHNSGDVGPYITAGIMTVRDPETKIRNSGIYRLMIRA